LAQDIARIALRNAVTVPLAAGIGKGIEGLFKADGGPVTAGSTYIVGERGPEVFMPSVSGSIVPNHALGGGGVTVVQNISIDSRSDQASIMQAMAMSAERAKNDIMASLNRGGEFARATGRA
jgi:phage-related minor tail protein